VGAELSILIQTGREAHPAHVQCVSGLFPRPKVARAWRLSPFPQSDAEVKGRAIPLLHFWAFLVCSKVYLTEPLFDSVTQ